MVSRNRTRGFEHHAFDTEDNTRGRAYLFNFYDVVRGVHTTFADREKALDYACSHRNRIYWAVNLEYDINNLFRGHFGLLRYIYAGSRLIVAELPEDKIRFFDTLNHWPLSVKKMGERIGLPKLEFKHGGRVPGKKQLEIAINE